VTARVAIVVPWGERLGGAEQMLWTFLRHVDRSAVEPSVILLEDGSFREEVRGLGFQTVVVASGRLRDARAHGRAVRRLTHRLRAEEPDLVLNWTPKAQIYVAPVAARLRLPVLWWQHGIPHGHWMDRIATALPCRAVGCSSVAAALAQQTLRPRRSTVVVRPGTEPNAALSLTRNQLGIPAGRAVLSIVGRLQPDKGQHRFLMMIRELLARGRNVHGLVVGGDAHGLAPDYARSVHTLRDELRLRDRVTMTGHVDDAVPYIGVSDVLVNASDTEGFGITLIEAMSRGVPIVAGARGGPEELLADGAVGVLAASSQPSELADAVQRLLDDPDRAVALGAAGRERYTGEFTADAMSRRLEAALGCVAANQPAPRSDARGAP
jgi:glycosyltransferase involved in cell wall biosynthesis